MRVTDLQQNIIGSNLRTSWAETQPGKRIEPTPAEIAHWEWWQAHHGWEAELARLEARNTAGEK